MNFADVQIDDPDLEAYRAHCARIVELLGGDDADAALRAVTDWDTHRRSAATWLTLAMVRFAQDVTDDDNRARKERSTKLSPKLDTADDAVRRALLDSAHRGELERALGRQAFALWQADADSYRPTLEADREREEQLVDRYMELMGTAQIEVPGLDAGPFTLSALRPLFGSVERDVRRAATVAFWDWFAEHGNTIDGVFDELVGLRTDMARKLGHDTYTPMGYDRMRRIGYGPDDVARFREEVVRTLGPLQARIERIQADKLGLDALSIWDRGCYAREGNPTPQGDPAWMQDQASAMFAELDPRIQALFDRMRDEGTLDLVQRAGKQPGGFCTSLYDLKLPFVFANFSGSQDDVVVFTHEMGHAYQFWQCRDVPVMDLVTPTFETAEILSMGLEFLTRDQMARFFGESGAATYRWIHTARIVNGILRWVEGDDWQHRVYADPGASPAERHAMWLACESLYKPTLDYGGLEHPARGASWQPIGHVFFMPFYLIDYALAGTAALQMWALDGSDHAAAMEVFNTLARTCTRQPLHEGLASVGLRSPFEPGCLEEVAERLDRELDHV